MNDCLQFFFCLSKEFNQMFSLKIHMNVHNNKPYKCSLCDKTFSQSSNLKNHLNVHNGNRPHKCDVCGKGFNQISSLRSHKYGHSGDKPHKCTVCDKTYTQSYVISKYYCGCDKKKIKILFFLSGQV